VTANMNPQERANFIGSSVADMAARQIAEALQTDPLRQHLTAFFTDAIDGVYLTNPTSPEFPVLISKEELVATETVEDWFKIIAQKRQAMGVPMPTPEEVEVGAEAGE